MKTPAFKYYSVKPHQCGHVLEFGSIEDFQRFAEANHLKHIFLLLDEAANITHFAVSHSGGLLQQAALGFKTIEDYFQAQKEGFPGAADYYEAMEKGYSNFADYQFVREAGIADAQLFEKIKTAGFTEGIKQWESLQKEPGALKDAGHFANAYELYRHALENGFETFDTFRAARLKGFKDAATYKVALERGFTLAGEYEDSVQRGFLDHASYAFALEHQLRDSKDRQRFSDLGSIKCQCVGHDEKVLLILLSRLEQGKRISINKLEGLHRDALAEYLYPDTGTMPLWFTASFNDREDMIRFLRSSEDVRKYGIYDPDGEFFEVNRMQDRMVVIDGSNVAHNNKKQGDKPYLKNIILLVRSLKEKGFTDISVIADASLKHRLADKDSLEELQTMSEYIEAPAEKPADVFLIQYVKTNHCLLVSNDTFREWKVQDPWVAENIDYYRLSFMIRGAEVLMPDLK